MKPLLILILLLTTSIFIIQSQNLSKSPYFVVIGIDTLETQISNDYRAITFTKEKIRIIKHLNKDKITSINYPKRNNSLQEVDIESGKVVGELIDTSDHLDVNTIVDTINISDINNLLLTEIKIFCGLKQLQIIDFSVTLLWPNGTEYIGNYTNKKKIGHHLEISNKAPSLPANGHLVLNDIYFIDENNLKTVIEGKIAWRIK